MAEVLRAMTDEERKQINEIGRKSPREVFMSKLAESAMVNQKAYKPFCQRCALLDYDDKVESAMKEIKRTEASVSANDERVTKINIDLSPYGELARFDLIDKAEIIENRNLNGDKVAMTTGYWYNYRCKSRKCGAAVEVPKAVHDSREALKK